MCPITPPSKTQCITSTPWSLVVDRCQKCGCNKLYNTNTLGMVIEYIYVVKYFCRLKEYVAIVCCFKNEHLLHYSLVACFPKLTWLDMLVTIRIWGHRDAEQCRPPDLYCIAVRIDTAGKFERIWFKVKT